MNAKAPLERGFGMGDGQLIRMGHARGRGVSKDPWGPGNSELGFQKQPLGLCASAGDRRCRWVYRRGSAWLTSFS